MIANELSVGMRAVIIMRALYHGSRFLSDINYLRVFLTSRSAGGEVCRERESKTRKGEEHR